MPGKTTAFSQRITFLPYFNNELPGKSTNKFLLKFLDEIVHLLSSFFSKNKADKLRLALLPATATPDKALKKGKKGEKKETPARKRKLSSVNKQKPGKKAKK